MLSAGEILVLGQSLIEEFLNTIRDELIEYLDNNDRNATGRSKASLQVINLTATTGTLIGSDSIEFVFRGRGPGRMPPIFAIIEWCAARGIPRAAAWAIARNIANAGTKLYQNGARRDKNVLLDIVSAEKIEKLTEDLTALYSAQIKSDIEEILKAA